MLKFKADTSMTIAGYMGLSDEIDITITAMFSAPDSIEVLRVEAYDAKTKTLHMLPEFMVDLLTGNEPTKVWLLEEAADRLGARIDFASRLAAYARSEANAAMSQPMKVAAE